MVRPTSMQQIEQFARSLRNEIAIGNGRDAETARLRVRAGDLCDLILDRDLPDPYGIVNHGNHALDLAILGLRATTADGWTFTPTAEDYGVGFVIDDPTGHRTWVWLAWTHPGGDDDEPILRLFADANRCPETMTKLATVEASSLPLRPKLPKTVAGPGERYPRHRMLQVDAQVGDELRRYQVEVDLDLWETLVEDQRSGWLDEQIGTGDLDFVVINDPDLTPVVKATAWV